MVKEKKVKFYYYGIKGFDSNNEEKIIDFSGAFDELIVKYSEDKFRHSFLINDEKYKLDSIKFDSDSNYYHLVIELLRDYNWPSKSKELGSSENLKFEDEKDEEIFLGEKVSILYDKNNNAFMVQSNKNGIQVGSLEVFLASILKQQGLNFDIRLPIIIQNDTEKIAKSLNVYKMVQTRFNVDDENTELQKNLFDMLFPNLKGYSEDLTLEVKATARKDKTGNDGLPDAVVHDIISTKGNDSVDLLKVRGRDIDGKSIPIDLIKNKVYSEISFQYTQDKTLNHINVFRRMAEEYNLTGRKRVVKYK